MDKIMKITGLFLSALIMVMTTSCGSKVNKEELDKKIMESKDSEQEPEFTAAEYGFMIDYLTDNYEKLSNMDINDKEAEMAMAYSFILLTAQMEGKLNQNLVKKYRKLQEKGQEYLESNEYKENEKAIMEALENSDIDWNEAYEEIEANVEEDVDWGVEAPVEVE